MIKEGKKLSQIANERGMAISTIQGHILRISQDFPDVDLSKYKPEQSVFRKISEAYALALEKASPEDFGKDGRLKSSIIFSALKAQVDYGTIKLAYAFL